MKFLRAGEGAECSKALIILCRLSKSKFEPTAFATDLPLFDYTITRVGRAEDGKLTLI